MTSHELFAGGRYRLGSRIGQGGMATVHLAGDLELDRPVAVKLLAENLLGDEEVRRRFQREARLAASLGHPNVVQVFDVGEEGGRPYIVMEYVEGSSLAGVMHRRGHRCLPPRRVAELLSQAAAGLAHAHEAGLVHRDVKPHNLLLRERDDRLKVADFGVARALEDTGLTRTGIVLGTKPYMAPEQLQGGEISAATDVYACGVVARELLTGRTPAEDETPRARGRSSQYDARSRPSRKAAVEELDPVVERCLNVDPAQRFADAGSLHGALSSLLEDPATAPPAGSPFPLDDNAGSPLAEAAQLRADPAPTARRLGGGWTGGRVLAAGGAIFAVGVALALSAGRDLGGGGAGPSERRVQPSPKLQDPGQQARALADWLRKQSR